MKPNDSAFVRSIFILHSTTKTCHCYTVEIPLKLQILGGLEAEVCG